MENNTGEVLIKSKERVRQNGEVFTPKQTVIDMTNLDGIREASYTIDKTFLEPACGNGNFLVELIERKLSILLGDKTSTDEYELQSIHAISTIYGVDIQADNVVEARERMYNIILNNYKNKMGNEPGLRYQKVVQDILAHNIILGDFLKSIMLPLKYNGKQRNTVLGSQKDIRLVFREYEFNGDKVVVRVSPCDNINECIKEYQPMSFTQLDKLPFSDIEDDDI